MKIKNAITIKKAKASDRTIIQNLIVKSDIYHYNNCISFKNEFDNNPEKYNQQSLTLVDKINISDFYIMNLKNIPIGTIMSWNNNGETTLINFYIEKEYRNQGYGKILLNYVIKNMKTTYCVLSVFKENKTALNFYYHFGFKFLQFEKTKSGDLFWLIYSKNKRSKGN